MLTLLLVGCKAKTKSVKPEAKPKLKALIIDGENSHGIWPKSTFMMKDYLEQTGLFEVDINRTNFNWIGPHHNEVEGITDIKELISLYPLNDGKERQVVDTPKMDPNFSPNFNNYDVVISNFGWKSSDWSESTKVNFENYMKNGGGLVTVHAANNPWGNWLEFNKMIGLGAWGGRDHTSGPYVYYNDKNEVEFDESKGICGSHGKQQNFLIKTREKDHPIMKGLPEEWLHAKDELYERMRGPAKNMTILATAYSDANEDTKRTGRHEPMLLTINYGNGRIFHSTLGHMDYSFECSGFITTFQRGAEWAATGNVTQDIPKDFPTADSTSSRKWIYKPE
ncbi:ThuA domain-containing protein [Seonamhaeicola sp. ML3]|uniref:ThuA domain-containing protein n=1 Tax=Seonamhaeicola sp. ML3 TaxID=2937786 RepID=UPI00200EAB9A|nr:ThuA domain-containing protein [Seonamhaeicola sp. ML3]